MNDMTGRSQGPREPSDLPELSDESVARIERAVFSEIGATRQDDLDAARRRRARRGRWWAAGGAAAAVVIVAAVIAPTVGGLVRGSSGASDSMSDGAFVTTEAFDGMPSGPVELAPESARGAAGDTAAEGGTAAGQVREVIATATATLEVAAGAGAARAAADAIAAAAEAAGGYVESLSVDGSAADNRAAGGTEVTQGDVMTIMPYPAAGTWVTVRVPADQLPAVMADLDELGDVTASQITRQDVTTQAVDLRARVESAQASVARLTELMAQAGSVADLIAAESALAERQAELESWQQQLEYLDQQVALSSLTVSIVAPTEAVEADPAGFGDGLIAGWNGLIATLNGIVIALGFLLPWLAVAAVAWLVVWLVLRGIRRRRRAATPPSADGP